MKVVTITSMALERDSRTYKFAASVARLGHESVVVEGERSGLFDEELPFELISPAELDPFGSSAAAKAPVASPAAEAAPAHRPLWRRALAAPRVAVAPLHNAWVILRDNLRDRKRRNDETAALLPDADVYWLHSFFQLPAVRAKVKETGATFLYDTPDAYWEPGMWETRGAMTLAMRGYERMEKRGVRAADAFTSVSDGIADVLEARFGRRPEVVRNFHDLRLDQPSDTDVRSATGVGDDDFLLVVVGNNKTELMVAETLHALRDLPDRVHAAFVGRRHEENRGLVEELGLGDRVHIIGHVAPTRIVSFISTADAAPVLSRGTSKNDQASLPNKFFHGIAAGLPLLYPGLPEMKKIAELHELGVEIDPSDPVSVAAGVRALADDPPALERFRANAAKARETLNWEHEEGVLGGILDGAARR